MATEVLGLPELTSAQAKKFLTYNKNLRQLEAMTVRVLSRTNSGPPGTPAEGDSYVIDSSTGAWSAFSVDNIAQFYLGVWREFPVTAGMHVIAIDEGTIIWYDGASWGPIGTLSNNYVTTTTSQTLVIGGQYFVDTSGGSITLTLPSSPAINATVEIVDITPNSARTAGQLDNPYDLDPNGEVIEEETTVDINAAGLKYKLIFTAATRGWVIIGS